MAECPRCGKPVPPKPPGSPGAPRRFCSRNCQKRAWDEQPGTCPRCGGPKTRRPRVEHCISCERELRRIAEEARLEDIALMWEAGMSAVAIARELGYGPNSTPPQLSELMRRGRIQARRESYRRKHEAARNA